MTNMLQNLNISMIGLAAAGYVLNLLKGIPRYFISLAYQKWGYNYTTDEFKVESYAAVEWLISELNPKILERHASGIPVWKMSKQSDDIKRECKGQIAPGIYTIFKNKTFISVYKAQNQLQQDVGNGPIYFVYNITMIGFGAKEIMDKIKDMERKAIEQTMKGNPNYFNLLQFGRYGEPTPTQTSKRRWDTIFNDEKDILRDHIHRWMNMKQLYKDNGLPYKTAILLYGKPGTGKSTLIRALASELNWPVSMVNSEHVLTIHEYNLSHTILVVEEIDKAFGTLFYNNNTVEERNEWMSAKISAFMQFLDGLISRDDIIIIATTNHYEKLDPALVRDGRFDLKLEMNYISKKHAVDMIKHYGLNPDDFELSDENIPATLQVQIFKKLGVIKE